MQKNIQIFIVDDDPFWSGILAQMLTQLEYLNIASFNSGSDCLKNLSLNPKLVFLDYQMDNMDGIEVLQKIKKHNPETGVVFCTAHEDITVVIDAMKQGSFDFILKSAISNEKIAALIEKMTDNQVFADKVF